MNEQKIHELLQRYFDGDTTLDEERQLQRYFAESDVAESLKAYRPMFALFAEERKGFEFACGEGFAVQVSGSKFQVSGSEFRVSISRKIRIGLSVITGIAASVALLFLVNLPEKQPDNYVYLVDGRRVYDESAALQLAEDKLQLLAASMQRAQNSMTAFDKVQESQQALQKFGTISNAFQQLELINIL